MMRSSTIVRVRLILRIGLSCAALCFVGACTSKEVTAQQGLADCVTELEAQGRQGIPVSWDSVLTILQRRASEFREIDGGSNMGITFYEYELTIAGQDYWVDMSGQPSGPEFGALLEIHTLTFRRGLAAAEGEVVAELDFRD